MCTAISLDNKYLPAGANSWARIFMGGEIIVVFYEYRPAFQRQILLNEGHVVGEDKESGIR